MSHQVCTNCNKNIPLDKHPTHQAYCSRNIIKCLVCHEFYDKKDPNDHLLLHQLITCSKCREPYESRLESQHTKSCKAKTVECDFCQIPIKSSQWIQHITQCGGRTQECFTCGKFVTLREKQTHMCSFNRQKFNKESNRQRLRRRFEDQEDVQIIQPPSKRFSRRFVNNNSTQSVDISVGKGGRSQMNEIGQQFCVIQSDQSFVQKNESKQKRLYKRKDKKNQTQESKLSNQQMENYNFQEQEQIQQISESMMEQIIARSKIQF